MDLADESCQTCVHWRAHKRYKAAYGMCHAWAPYDYGRTIFPCPGHYVCTTKDQWCARYRQFGGIGAVIEEGGE